MILGCFGAGTSWTWLPGSDHANDGQSCSSAEKTAPEKRLSWTHCALCLYGPIALGSRVSSREYENYLEERIHRADNTLLQPTGAGVAVEFDYAQAGVMSSYLVTRRWDRQDKTLRSTLVVKRDGIALDGLDRENADEFLRDSIPPGVSQLFFFDGEKIQQLADGEQDHVALADAVRGLIGLDHVERLQGDLRVYAGKLQDLPTTGPLREQLEGLAREKEVLDTRRLDLVRQDDQNAAKIGRLQQDIARAKQKLSKAGGAYANRRESLDAERVQLKHSIEEAEAEIRTLCEGVLPVVLAADLCHELRRQMLAEREVLRWGVHEAALCEKLGEIKSGVGRALFPPGESNEIPAATRKVLRQRVESILGALIVPPPDLPSVAIIHRISDEDRGRIVNSISRALDDLPPHLGTIQQRLELRHQAAPGS